MSLFQEITAAAWDDALQERGVDVSVFLSAAWAKTIADTLPFVSFACYRYRDNHVVRVAKIGDRYTTAPFSEGGDVVALTKTALSLPEFAIDCQEQFGDVRLRVNERMAPVAAAPESWCVAQEYVVDLSTPLLPRVRKTVRHILQRPPVGTITNPRDNAAINVAYRLYVAHMRRVANLALPRDIFSSLITDHGADLWLYTEQDTPLAMALFIHDGREVLYSLSAATPSALRHHAAHHVVHQALTHYATRGATVASLGATGLGSPLEVFKRGWRGEQYAMYELGDRAGVGRTSRVRQLVRYVPLSLYPSLTRLVGAHVL